MKIYHGSSRKLKVLRPRQATGIKKAKDRQIAVYATHKKERAIVITLIHLKGIRGGFELRKINKEVGGIIYGGWPTQKDFYLYELPKKTFSKIDSWQWISKEEVRPLKVERLEVKDYLYLLKKGSKIREKEISRKSQKV